MLNTQEKTLNFYKVNRYLNSQISLSNNKF